MNVLFPENIHTHPNWVGSWVGVSKGTGVLNAQIYNRKYEAKLEFPGGTQTMVQIFYATAQSQINFEKILLKCKPTAAV